VKFPFRFIFCFGIVFGRGKQTYLMPWEYCEILRYNTNSFLNDSVFGVSIVVTLIPNFGNRNSFKFYRPFINSSLHLAWKYARIFVCGHYLFQLANIFRERSSRKAVSYEEQLMSKDKCPSIFSPQMEAVVFIILQIFFATRAVLKIGEYSRIFPSFSGGIFAHVTRLDQSRASENIWWIIMYNMAHLNGL